MPLRLMCQEAPCHLPGATSEVAKTLGTDLRKAKRILSQVVSIALNGFNGLKFVARHLY